jgi:hypothetical protein
LVAYCVGPNGSILLRDPSDPEQQSRLCLAPLARRFLVRAKGRLVSSSRRGYFGSGTTKLKRPTSKEWSWIGASQMRVSRPGAPLG